MFPTLAGAEQHAQGEAPSDISPDAEGSAERRRTVTDTLDFSRWSSQQMESLARRVRNAIGDNLNRQTSIRVTLGMSACDLRNVQAHPSERLTPQAMRQRLQEATGDLRIRSYSVLDGHQEPNRLKILSVPEELADGLAIKLDLHGLTPESIEGLPLNLAGLAPQAVDEIQIVIDWGLSNPTLVACCNGAILYVRRLKAGSIESMISQFCVQYELTKSEAVRWLWHCLTHLAKGTNAQFYSEDVSDQAALSCQQLAREIGSAVEFIRWKNPDRKLGQVTLTGGAAELPGLADMLAKDIRLGVQTWSKTDSNTTISPIYAQAARLAEGASGAKSQ